MGRFGNELLINGETAFTGEAMVGEVVRLYLVNTANTRIFNFAVRGAQAKLIDGDSGRYERETFVEEVLLAPSERAIIDVLFEPPEGCDSSIELRTGSTTSGHSLFRRPRVAAGPRRRSRGRAPTPSCRPSTEA
jgi:FtsP/CotA-like multicopper oxidase with cupredoxin domain